MVSFSQYLWIWYRQEKMEMPQIHLRVAKWLDEADCADRRSLLILGFRGLGKSTLLAVFSAWALLRDPNTRILIVSANAGLASKLVMHSMAIFQKHQLSRGVLAVVRRGGRLNGFTVERSGTLRDPSIIGKGILGNIAGDRADYIIYDDVEVPSTTSSKRRRDVLRARIKDCRFVLNPDGKEIMLGTPHACESIYLGDENKVDGYGTHFDRLKIPVFDGSGNSTWPERFSNQCLEKIKMEIGSELFQAQMMLEPLPIGFVRFHPDKIKTFCKGSLVGDRCSKLSVGGVKIVNYACCWDISLGRRNGGDGCAIALLGLGSDGCYYLLDLVYLFCDAEKDDCDEMTVLCCQALRFVIENKVDRVFVESNGIGQFMSSFFRKFSMDRGYQLQVVPFFQKRNKFDRINGAIEPLVMSGRLYIREDLLDDRFRGELCAWGTGENGHDDGLDALASCIELCPSANRDSTVSAYRNAIVDFDPWLK